MGFNKHFIAEMLAADSQRATEETRRPVDNRGVDARANDLWHWQTKLTVIDANQAAQVMRERQIRFISSGVLTLSASEQATAKSFVVCDPDGHAMQLSEK